MLHFIFFETLLKLITHIRIDFIEMLFKATSLLENMAEISKL